jgi:hypothetical protein
MVGGACAIIACGVSLILILLHATHYSKPIEQRQWVSHFAIRAYRALLTWSPLPSQYHPHPIHGPRLFPCRMAKHVLLS